ncbi:AAA family ATPase [Phormidium tenue]|uniref:AAA family ATPase n=1 Tax=Phormidium tenue FACHB-1050 TaxID=2692857 RepID=A0ABR8CES7_9CYAN|nr:AAA family ATPase [Phormidium tenue]MBD2319129.1 AAA family ATPase [Phormidium tenue FACHB-1050]
MHIQQVKIKNFRCFEDLTINLNPDINIFVGNNGSGKSAVLDAISAAMYPYISQIQRIANQNEDKSPIFKSDLSVQKNNLKQENKRITPEFQALVKGFPEWFIKYNNIFSREDGNVFTDENSIGFGADFGSPKLSKLLRSIDDKYKNEREDNTLDLIIYYKENRNGIIKIKDVFNQSSNKFNAFKNALNASANFTDLADWFFIRRFHELSIVQKTGNTKFELPDLKQIRKAISTIIAPNATVDFAQDTSARLMVEWETETGEKIELSLNQLSSGYRNMLALVMDFARRLAQANPQMENPLEAEAVLMIDELDLHLHPTWQQKIIPDLRKVFPNTQIIATTHSPEIVTTVQRHQVKILEDYQIKECPSPTRGMKSSDVVRYVLGLDNLRPNTEESRTLTALFEAIDNGNLEEAKRLRDKLQDWKSFDPDITRADMQIRRLEREMTA